MARKKGTKLSKKVRMKCGPGRFTEKIKQRVLKFVREGYPVVRAARKAGTTDVTVFDHRRKDPEFGKAFEEALEAGTDMLEDKLHDMAIGGNITAIFGTLKARRPQKWREHYKIDHGADGSFAAAFAMAMTGASSGQASDSKEKPSRTDRPVH